MEYNQSRSVPAVSATSITRNVTLSFEIGTSNISTRDTDQCRSEREDGNETCPPSDNGIGKSQDRSHENHREVGSGYLINN